MTDRRPTRADAIGAAARLAATIFEARAARISRLKARTLQEAADAYHAHLAAGGDPNYPCTWLRRRADEIDGSGPPTIRSDLA